jgi:hypothetical protein
VDDLVRKPRLEEIRDLVDRIPLRHGAARVLAPGAAPA